MRRGGRSGAYGKVHALGTRSHRQTVTLLTYLTVAQLCEPVRLDQFPKCITDYGKDECSEQQRCTMPQSK